MAKAKKFGLFGGVFTPSILTILGVIMYLRLPWIVGQAGLIATLGIIVLAHLISGSTGLSIASIATDKRVGTGGTYFIISRSLGLPIGGTLGYALFVGLSFSVSLYLIGFAESFLSYFGFEVNLFTVRLTGSIILLLVTILTFISTSLAIKTQYLILTVMILSLLAIFLGNHDYKPYGSQLHTLPEALPWISLFAIFFPAVTGFEAGVSMSGDLKDPRRDIPFGTILAILTGLLVYVCLAIFLSFTVNRELLINDSNALFRISFIPQFVIAGILGATFSSALGSILGAPRILQAVASDRIAPSFFSKGYGPSNEPRNALILTFIIAQAGILIGELNAIARIVTIFFIITYGFLNITYTVESWASSDFRPSFKIPRFVSIAGSLACIIVMIQLDILAMAAASLVLISLFFFLKNKELNLQTGDTRSSIWLSLIKTGLFKLTKSQDNTRNWRPNVILFSGSAGARPHLIEIGKALVGKLGIFTNFELIEHPGENLLFSRTARVSSETIGGFTDVITRKHECRNIYEGIEMISKIYGFTGFEPNTILMGWAKNTRDPEKYAEMLVSLKKLDYNLAFLNYNKERGFGDYKKIDIWWQGKGRNLPLAIHLIRFITGTTEWRNAEIRILSLCSESRNMEKYYVILNQIIENYRIKAKIKVINNVEKIPEKDHIRSESSESDLIIAEIPDFNKKNIFEIIGNTNEIIETNNSFLLIHAASTFEEINVISDMAAPGKISLIPEKPPLSIVDKLNISGSEYIINEIHNLAGHLEESSVSYINNVLFPVPENKNAYIEQFKTLSIKALENLSLANKLKNQQDKQWEYLRIINDYSFHVQKLLQEFKAGYLKYEHETLEQGISKYLSEIQEAFKILPEKISIQFNRKELRQLKTSGIIEWLERAGKIILINFSGKTVKLKINIHKTYRIYIYHKRLYYFKRFTEQYFSQNFITFSELKKLLRDNYDVIEQALANKLTIEEINDYQENCRKSFVNIQNENEKYIYAESHELLDKLISNLENYNKIIHSPLSSARNSQFRAIVKKDTRLQGLINNFFYANKLILNNFLNKALLDFIFLTLKNRIKTKFEKTILEIEILLQSNILGKLKTFTDQLNSLRDIEKLSKNKKYFPDQKEISMPDLEEYFNQLINEIKELVFALPETIQVSDDELTDEIKLEQLDDLNELQVSVRKAADFYISNELNDQLKRQWIKCENELSLSLNKIRDTIRLASFQLYNTGSDKADESDVLINQEQKNKLIDSIINSNLSEEIKIKNLTKEIRQSFEIGLKNAFEPLSSDIIIRASASITKITTRTGRQKIIQRFQSFKTSTREKLSNRLVKLLYTTSEGQVWARRMEHLKEKESVYTIEQIRKITGKLSPSKAILESLPFYYANLFSGSSRIGGDFLVEMSAEIEKGSRAVKRFIDGSTGFLIISGEPDSGKSTLSKQLAGLHFNRNNIYNVRAPRECTADVRLFEETLLKSINGKDNLQYDLSMLPSKSVIIIHDLELWWQRKPFGTHVVEKLISLMQEFSNSILFIINTNENALSIINQLTSLNIWALDIIYCQPFDARDLKNLILLRHQAGAMKFILNKTHEDQMTEWDYARLFNRYFVLSSGNPGLTIKLWLANIKKISANTLFIEKPVYEELRFADQLSQYEIMHILQFVIHRRFSIKNLAALLLYNIHETGQIVHELLKKNILIERYPETYSLNPVLEIYLIKKLKSLELI